MDDKVKKKISFVKATEVAATLGIDPKVMPKWLPGGASPYEYDFAHLTATPSAWLSVRDGPLAHTKAPGAAVGGGVAASGAGAGAGAGGAAAVEAAVVEAAASVATAVPLGADVAEAAAADGSSSSA